MDNTKLIQEIKKDQYNDLRLANIYFNAVYQNIINNQTDEEIMIKLIAMLCKNIEDLTRELNKQKLQNTRKESGLFNNKRKSLSGLFPDGKFMND